MPKIKLSYKAVNKLDEYLNRKVGNEMSYTGIKITKKEIMNELADYCGVGYENINRIKSNTAQPSLAVALRIAKFFDTNVENIFEIS